jgi:calcineurin-like phosphoesterase family protein
MKGDILIHAGDFTLFGKEKHAKAFNEWLGRQKGFKHKIVVLGNHEENSEWNAKDSRAKAILSNAVLLQNEEITVMGLRIFGTRFFWPMKGTNPHYEQIQPGVDIVICHGPAKGCADGSIGCGEMLKTVQRVGARLCVSGHVHSAYGTARLTVSTGSGPQEGVLFVNAAAPCRDKGRKVGNAAVVVDMVLEPKIASARLVGPPILVER